jgi:hypothetical protein
MRGSTQSYGLADRLLSQAAIMVMAVSGDTRLTGPHSLHNSLQAFYEPGPNGIEV